MGPGGFVAVDHGIAHQTVIVLPVFDEGFGGQQAEVVADVATLIDTEHRGKDLAVVADRLPEGIVGDGLDGEVAVHHLV